MFGVNGTFLFKKNLEKNGPNNRTLSCVASCRAVSQKQSATPRDSRKVKKKREGGATNKAECNMCGLLPRPPIPFEKVLSKGESEDYISVELPHPDSVPTPVVAMKSSGANNRSHRAIRLQGEDDLL